MMDNPIDWENLRSGDPLPEPPANDEPDFGIDNLDGDGIVPLGYDHAVFYYFSRSMRQVCALSAGMHTKNSLMALASVPHYWERTRHFRDSSVKWDAAIDDLMECCRRAGIYDSDRIRGRGAWLDQGTPVLHMGDHLLVGGQRQSLTVPGSRFVYEAARPFAEASAPALSARDAYKLVDICRSLRWERGIDGTLLAGFIAVAPICGALYWRPSIWLTGSKGSGKSWCEQNILVPSLGRIALRVQGTTTEPAIRRVLGSDARPVLFDEAEQEDQNAAARMQAVLGLVRQSSTEDGAEIIKASQGDGVARFRIRSCFAFSSINVGIVHSADESRITKLALRTPVSGSSSDRAADDQRFQALAERVASIITPEFSAGLLARSVMLLPTIRANAETFARAVSIHLGNRRLGDQIGTLLAGAYSLHRDGLISTEDAAAFVQREEWQGEVEQSAERDELRLLSRITQHRVGVSTGTGARQELTIGRMLEAASRRDTSTMSAEVAIRELREHGIKYLAWGLSEAGQDGEGVFVSGKHSAIADILRNTPWASAWANSLRRIDGAQTVQAPVRFNVGHTGRAVFLPWSSIDPETEP